MMLQVFMANRDAPQAQAFFSRMLSGFDEVTGNPVPVPDVAAEDDTTMIATNDNVIFTEEEVDVAPRVQEEMVHNDVTIDDEVVVLDDDDDDAPVQHIDLPAALPDTQRLAAMIRGLDEEEDERRRAAGDSLRTMFVSSPGSFNIFSIEEQIEKLRGCSDFPEGETPTKDVDEDDEDVDTQLTTLG
jgi:hypothetical protein